MNYIANITLDVACAASFKCIRAKQGDKASRFVKITLSKGGEIVTVPNAATARFRAGKPDGSGIYNIATINNDGTVTVEFTAQTLAVAGNVRADVEITENGAILATATFIIIVEDNPLGDTSVESTSEFLVLTELIDDAEDVIAEGREVIEQIEGISESASFVHLGFYIGDDGGVCQSDNIITS